MLHPITFSIPEEKILTCIPRLKTKILSDLIPGKLDTYIYNNEIDYYNEYRTSYFAVTMKKAGWDCMRHYEIISNGCLPYFPDIEECPYNTMYLCPKQLFIDSNSLYQKLILKKISDLSEFDIIEYNILLTKIIKYTKDNLSTNKIAKYILEKSRFEHISKILYLSGNIDPDYLRCLTLHGFKEKFGKMCHDYPKVPHIYKSNDINYSNLYGKGITYTNLLDSTLHDDNLDQTIEQDIERKYYDIIIYGSYHRGTPYYELVSKIYNPSEIILLCGEDIHCCNYPQLVDRGHTVFVRELN